MTLQNYDQARKNMVLSQLQPSGIVSEKVMAAYQAVPREMFVPNGLRGVSYLDDDIALGGGRTLMEPLLHALMVQAANISAGDKVLDIGGATGYSAAVLANLGANVVALEQEEKLLQEANARWKELELSSKVTPVVGDHVGGYAANAPYKAILINGAVAEIPVKLLSQLTADGVLLAILKTDADGMGTVISVRQDGAGNIAQTILGEGVTVYAPGFAPKAGFSF